MDLLGESERLIAAMGDGVYALDAEGRYVEVNEYLLDLVGYDRERFLGSSATLLHSAAEIERFESAIQSLLASGTDDRVRTVETTVETASGEHVPVEVNLTLLLDDGEFRGSVGVIRDVTERKRRERDLERYELIVEASGDAVYALDTDGRFTFCNEAHLELLGYDEDALLGEHASVTLPPAAVEEGRELIETLLTTEGRRRGTYEMDVVTSSGERIPTENHVALLYDDEGAFRGTVGVLRDISERKAREEELRRQNERLERFASVVSHDLRNPLTVAQGHLELIDDPETAEVATSLDRMESIIEDVLQLARQGQTIDDTVPVSVEAAARTAWANVETGDLSLDVTGDATLLADEGRLVGLLENLFRNTREHATGDGEATTVTVGVEGGCLFVADDGPGIPAEERDRVLEMGYSTSEAGTGFGLAIVSEIAQAHGWTVRVSDSDGGGARFSFAGVDFVDR